MGGIVVLDDRANLLLRQTAGVGQHRGAEDVDEAVGVYLQSWLEVAEGVVQTGGGFQRDAPRLAMGKDKGHLFR